MNSLDDLIRRNVQTFRPRTNGHQDTSAEPLDEFTELMRKQQAESVNNLRLEQLKRQQRLSEMAAEAEAMRVENELEEQRLRQEERRAERRALRSGGGGGGGDGGMLPALMDMMLQSQRDTQARIDALNAQQAEALKGELGALKDLIRAVMDKPAPDPIETVRHQIEFFQTLQGLVPKPTAEAKAQTVREMLEVKKFEAELDMERAKFQRDLQRDEVERARWEQEAQAAQNRATMLGGMIAQAMPQLTEAVTARIAQRPEKDVPTPPEPPPLAPWQCPGVEGAPCGHINHAAPGTTKAVCAKCELVVELGPAPPPAVESESRTAGGGSAG